ncbi:MAG: feruloyl-CoA synthase [Sulfitobacter sp.]|jgi:feruloyl-CoA synthase
MDSPPRFWRPEFRFDHRADGSVLMQHTEDLPDYPQVLADYLDHWADKTPDQTWIARRAEDGDWQRVSYAQARETARALGAALLDLGLGADRPLLILSENSLEHALLGMAAMYVGVPYAPLATAYSLVSKDHGKIKDIANLLNPGAVFADDGAKYGPAIAAIAQQGRRVINHRNLLAGAASFDDLAQHDPAGSAAARAGLTGDSVAKYLFTSGSTGSPKAVINSNRMLCASQAMVRDCYRFLEWQPPVVLDWAPWNHTAAGNKVSHLVLTNGGTFYIDDGKPTPDKFGETLRNLRDVACTWYFNVPVGYDMLIDELEADAALAARFFSELGMLFYAGASMSQQTWDRISALAQKITGRDFLLATGLGATETAPFALACTDVQDRPGNVGVPSRGLTLKLVPQGDKLEARLKGPTVMPGYYGDTAKSSQAFDDEGFYKFGDALRPADPDDFSKGFFFDGRLAENFKLSTGTWVAVGALRAALVDAMDGLIRDAVIVGEDQPQLGALLWLSAKAEAMDDTARTALLQKKLSDFAQTATGSSGRIRRAVALPQAPSMDRGEATEKGSLNQRALRAHNTDLIESLYEGAQGVLLA